MANGMARCSKRLRINRCCEQNKTNWRHCLVGLLLFFSHPTAQCSSVLIIMQMDCEIRRGNRCLPLSITKQKKGDGAVWWQSFDIVIICGWVAAMCHKFRVRWCNYINVIGDNKIIIKCVVHFCWVFGGAPTSETSSTTN